MKISIIIPSYQQAQYLASAINSALDQTVKAHEIIVIDDGSNDNSLQIAKDYENQVAKGYIAKSFPEVNTLEHTQIYIAYTRITKNPSELYRVAKIKSPTSHCDYWDWAGYKTIQNKSLRVISQTNRGLPGARNSGIMNSTGTYCLFLDADDMLIENAIERITQVAEQTNADIISPSLKCFGMAQDEIILMDNPTIDDFKVANRVGYCSAVKRDVLLEVGGYSPRMIWGYEDLALWFDLLSRGKKLVTIQEVLWLYRVKEKSMIHDAQAHHVELMAQIAKDFPQIFPK